MNVYTYEYSNTYHPPAPVVEIGISRVGSSVPEIKIKTLVDSAADAPMIPLNIIKAVKAEFIESVGLQGVTGVRSKVDIYAVTIRIGPHTIQDVWAVAIARGGEAILGRDVLNHLIVTLNGLASSTEILE